MNLIPVKGIEILIKAVIELNDPDLKLLIVGNDTGDYAEKLKNFAMNVKCIKFLGKKEDVRPYHKIADVFVIPTLELGEGLPIAPLEAMASGRIVIGSKVSGVKDILDPFPDCVFLPNNVQSLKECLLRIKNMKPEDKKVLEEDMRARVEKTYSIERFIESHTELYKELLLNQ